MVAVLQRSAHASRRRRAQDPVRKTGWQVHTSVADAVREAVEGGLADSQNVLVERAIVRYLADLRREKLYASYAEAARDPHFMVEMRDVANAFDATVADGLGD